MNRKPLLIVLTIAVAVVASACSSPSPKIAITTAPPASMEVNTSASITATVTHDSGKGVDWSCAPTGACGTFTPTHTASGSSTVYTAPSTAGSVTITAASTKKASVTATATVTVTPVATTASLTGTYTFFINGWDAGGFSYSVAGSVVLDGAGNITGGEQDFFDTTGPTIVTADPITAATAAVSVGDDGRGTITLTPTTAAPETLSITVVNNNHALITEFDANATSAGSLDLQTVPTSVPTGGNAFAVLDTADAFVFGGVVTSDGTALITTGEGDDDLTGTADFDLALTGSFTAPDAAGRGTITIIDPTFVSFPFTFAYYVVGPEAFRLIAIDGNTFAAGSMYGQGTAAGSYSAASLNGNFVFGQAGEENVGIGFYSAAGQFATDATSAFTAGVADVNEGDGAPVLAGDIATGTTYFVNADGYGGVALSGTTTDTLANFGVYLVDPALNVADPNSASGGGGAVMLDLDVNNLGAGIVVPQTSGASFVGNYAINQDGAAETSTTFGFFDLIGQIVSDGTSTFAGLGDFNDVNLTGQTAGVTLAGTFATDSANPGRATAQLTVNGSSTPNSLTAYQASSALVLHVDVDSSANGIGTIGLGVLEQQQ